MSEPIGRKTVKMIWEDGDAVAVFAKVSGSNGPDLETAFVAGWTAANLFTLKALIEMSRMTEAPDSFVEALSEMFRPIHDLTCTVCDTEVRPSCLEEFLEGHEGVVNSFIDMVKSKSKKDTSDNPHLV